MRDFQNGVIVLGHSQLCLGALAPRARKSIVSWYPGYQPFSNLAANFRLGRKPSQTPLRSNTGLTYDPASHQALVKSQSVAELRIQASKFKNKRSRIKTNHNNLYATWLMLTFLHLGFSNCVYSFAYHIHHIYSFLRCDLQVLFFVFH